MATVRTNDQVSPYFALALRSFYPNARDMVIFKHQVDDFILHVQGKGRESFCAAGQKVQKIPLRHESDKFAVRRQTREIRHRSEVTIEDSAQLGHFLMR